MPSLELPDGALSDDTVELRPWRDADIPALVAALADPAISLWIPVIPYPYSEDDARAFFALARREAEEGRGTHLAITEADGGRLLGNVALAPLSPFNRSAAVGYWIAEGERRRGVATRAVRLVLEWAFGALGLERVELIADVDNLASRRIARRLGFLEEGVMRSFFASRRGRRDAVLYARIRDQRPPTPSGLPARVSLVTLGVRDPGRMRAFFGALGWPEWVAADDGFTGYHTGGAVLALYPLESLASASRAEAEPGAWSGVTLAVNVADPSLVDSAIAAARAAGAVILVEPVDAEWGGRSGYFADPEGNRFEVAWMPGSSFDARGALILPPSPAGGRETEG